MAKAFLQGLAASRNQMMGELQATDAFEVIKGRRRQAEKAERVQNYLGQYQQPGADQAAIESGMLGDAPELATKLRDWRTKDEAQMSDRLGELAAVASRAIGTPEEPQAMAWLGMEAEKIGVPRETVQEVLTVYSQNPEQGRLAVQSLVARGMGAKDYLAQFETPGDIAAAKREKEGKERRIIKGADGKNYYADTGEVVLKGVKTPQEQFMEMIGEPTTDTLDDPFVPLSEQDPFPDLGEEETPTLPALNLQLDEGVVVEDPENQALLQGDVGDETLIGGTGAQPTVREIFSGLPAEVQAGIQSSKNPMEAFSKYMLKSKGMSISVDADGNIQVSQGGPQQYGKRATGDLESKLIATRDALARLTEVEQAFRPEFQEIATQLGASWSALKDKAGFDLSDEQASLLDDYTDFRVSAVDNLNRYIKEITGAAMSVPEAARITRGMPNPGTGVGDGDSPRQFARKLKTVTKLMKSAQARYVYALKNGWDTGKGALEKRLPLSKVGAEIDKRGAALEKILRKRKPDWDDTRIDQMVKARLSKEFELAQ